MIKKREKHIRFLTNAMLLIMIVMNYLHNRMTLLLGPPSSGKTTLLLALAGRLDPRLKVRMISIIINHKSGSPSQTETEKIIQVIEPGTGERIHILQRP